MTVHIPVLVDLPGIYDLPAVVYHSDPVPESSLSVSGARRLLPPSCPAKFQYWLDKEEHKPTYDLGHAAHTRVLGVGERITVIDADNWTTKTARQQRDTAYASRQVPLLRKDVAIVDDMAEKLDEHSIASAYLKAPGRPEVSLFWRDEMTSVARRARLDYLHDDGGVAIDYKSTQSSHPEAIAKAMYNYGYFMQGPWYQDAIVGCGLADFPEFVFIFQEKTPPYLVTVVRPDAEMSTYGHRRNRQAIELYYQCRTFDHWPGYTEQPITVNLPRWAIRELETEDE